MKIRKIKYDFANILLSGPCNLKCPHCIGGAMKSRRLPANLDRFPPAGLDRFTDALRRHGIREVSLTGADTEPQQYRFEMELLAFLRARVPGVRISLHTNGTLALKKPAVFNAYDRATVSMPSFEPETYRKMTGGGRMIDLPGIIQSARIPVKISTLVTRDNLGEIPAIIGRCRDLGITRMVLRKLYGDTREYDFFPEHVPLRYFGSNPVYVIGGMEITVWDFTRSVLDCLNLFSDGSITGEYEIARREQE